MSAANRLRQLSGNNVRLIFTGIHITLHHLGDYADSIPQNVVNMTKLASQSISFTSFQMSLDTLLSFQGKGGNRPFVLTPDNEIASLMQLHQNLSVELVKAGLRQYAFKPFKPHMTFLYDSQMIAEQKIEPVTWMVREFVLVHSYLGLTKHEHLMRWSLGE